MHSTNLVTLPSVWFSADGEVSTEGKELAISFELDTVAECSHLRHLGREHSLLLASRTRFSVDEVESETETEKELKLVSEPGTISTSILNVARKNFLIFCSSIKGPLKIILHGISMPPLSESLQYLRVPVTIAWITLRNDEHKCEIFRGTWPTTSPDLK